MQPVFAGISFLTHAIGVGVGVGVLDGLTDGDALGDAEGEAVGVAVGVTDGVGEGVPVTRSQTASNGLIWLAESTAVSVGLSNVGTLSPPRIIETVPVGET